MHELSLSGAIVDAVVRHAGGRPVRAVHLRVGRLRQVVPESLEFYFGFAAKGTVCEGARLELESLPALLRCSACDLGWELETPHFRCPRCGSAGVEVVSGEELELESIVVEEEEACTVRS